MRGVLSWCGRGSLSGRSPRERLIRRRARVGVIAGLVLALNITLLPSAMAFGPPDDDARTTVDLDELQKTDVVPLDEVKSGQVGQIDGQTSAESEEFLPAATAPVPSATGTKAVDNLTPGSTTQVAASTDGTLKVAVGAPAEATAAQADALEGSWSVDVRPESQAVTAGSPGLVLGVDAPDTATGTAVVSIDATRVAESYSAQWLDRLSFTLMPNCYETNPELEQCSTGRPVDTELKRTGNTVTVPVDAGDTSGSEPDPGEDTATDQLNGSTNTTEQVPETLLNLKVDTADLKAVATTTTTTTTTAASTDGGSVNQAVWRGSTKSGVQQVATSASDGVLVGTSYGAGAGGDFAASPVSSAGAWSQGGSTGAFTYSYTMAAPQVPAGPAPNVTLSYNSQSSDGRTSATNNQVSWVGEGWDYNPGSITRTFIGCAADTANANNDKHFTGDQCWGTYNAVLSLNGTTTELVRDDTTKQWKSARGDNMRIELLDETHYEAITKVATSNNRDNNGEFWRVTTSDGTQYYFGLNRLPGWTSGKPETNSVLTVPVAGNHSSDPCYATTFANSFCDQGWRFQLDYVVDTNGNAMTLWWNKEENAYARNMKETNAQRYDRAGYLQRIDYGQRAGKLFTEEPLGRVAFTAQERCFGDNVFKVACSDTNFKSKQSHLTRPWFDTPADLHCATGGKCSTYAPTFWSRKRLATVTACTQRQQGVRLMEYKEADDTGARHACGVEGDADTTTLLSKVDSWALDQDFPWNLTGEYTALWLQSIARTGWAVDGTTETLNPVYFDHNKEALPNRVRQGSSDTAPLFARPRIRNVISEYGGRTEVKYSTPTGPCATGTNFPPEDKNQERCYPVFWHADDELADNRQSWFHKYVVTEIVEHPQLVGSLDLTTKFRYETFTEDPVKGALWAKNTAEFSRKKTRTWDQWRGYPIVITETPVPTGTTDTKASKSVTRYFRGMSDDVLNDATPNDESDNPKRSYSMTDITGAVLKADRQAYAGMVAESLTYPDIGADTATGWISRSRNFPDDPVRLATRNRPAKDGPDVVAERVTLGKTETITKASGSTLRTVRTETEYDALGLPTVTREYGDINDTRDDACTRTSYVQNTAGDNYLVGLVSQTVTTTGTTTCSAELSTATQTTLVSASRMFYDGATSHTAAPTKGQVTRTEAPLGNGTDWQRTHPESRTVYDEYGRVTRVTDSTGLANVTEYLPTDTTGSRQVYSIRTIQGQQTDANGNETGFISTVTVEPGRGTTLTAMDANNRVTRYAYDPLGRTSAGWDAAQPATDDPTVRFTYNTDPKEPVSIESESLQDNPTSSADGDKAIYTKSTTIYDGLGRERQSQTPAVGGGRLVTDTFHNASGQVSFTRNAYYMDGEPNTKIAVPLSDSLVPNATTYTYDGLGRVLTVTPVHSSFAQTGEKYLKSDGTLAHQSTDRRTRYEYALDHTIVRQPVGTPASRVWTDALGRTVRQDTFSDTALSEAAAISTRYEYDLRGDMVKSTDAAGHSRTWKYDALGRVTDTTDPDTGATHTEYDDYGRVLTARDGRGTTLTYAYDRFNRVEQIKATPANSTTATVVQSYAYDGATGGKGKLLSATRYTDGKPYTTTIGGYTADYQPTSMTLALPPGTTPGLTADGFVTQYPYTYKYNSDGQMESYTTPAAGGLDAESVITRYNEAGLPVTVSGKDWYVAETAYSPHGQVLRATVGEQGRRVWQENTFHESTGELLTSKLKRETATDTGVVPGNTINSRSYGYDPSGNILTVADAYGSGITDRQCFTYDTLGQLRQAWTTPAGRACAAAGKSTAAPVYSDGTVNVSSNNSGYWQSYDYDVLGNRTKKTNHKADPTVSTTGVVDTALDTVTDYKYGTSDTALNDQPHTLTSYTTKSKANATSPTVTTGSTQTYDPTGNLETRTTGGDTAQALTWTWDGKAETVTGFGADGSGPWVGADGKCVDLTNSNANAGTALQVWTCNGTKAQNLRLRALDGDDNGTVDSTTVGQFVVGTRCAQPNGETIGSAVLIQVCNKANSAQRWKTLDTGQLQHVDTQLCLSTPNTTSGTDLTVETCNQTLATQLWKPASKTTYIYDGMGNRVLERTSAGAVLHLPDTKVSLNTTGGVRYAERTYGHAGAPTVTRYREASASGSTTEQQFALATDINGTPIAEVRLGDTMSVRLTKKDPWGVDRAISMTPRSHTTFHSGDDDAGTGLVHLGAREYDPMTGRFVSADPVLDQSDPLQANGYSYANNNPVTHADPSGLTSTASSFDASIAALEKKIAEYQRTLSRSLGDVILSVGWAVFKEFVGWGDVMGCFSQGDLWACGSLLMDAIPWTSVFSKGKRMWGAFKATKAAVQAWRAAKAAAEVGLKAAKAAKAALIKAKKAAEAAAAEAKRKAREAAKKAAEAAKRKSHTGSKGARGNPVQVKARTSAQSKGTSGGGRAENKSGGSRGGSGREDSGGGSDSGSGSGGGEGCPTDNSFTPDTKVLMADGSTKAIKDVKVGDKVVATDPETGETRVETVTAEILGKGVKHLVKVTVDVDGTKGTKTAEVTATDGHPFWVQELGEWIDATDLKSGEWLRTSAGTYVQITAVERWTAPDATVHNLTVSSLHTYYVLAGATPVLVHNCGTGDPRVFAVDSAGTAEILPVHVIDSATHAPQALNAQRAIDAGAPAILTRHTSDALERRNRRAAQAHAPRPRRFAPNATWEEYPFAHTLEGGAGATLTLSPGSVNSSHGSLLRWFWARNNVGNGDRFAVRIV
ncbi:ricin-type beta-trefoil lectin domain protein [Streptomyces sp. TRM72054]|uniref:ricin-type beta-trefoil lectin domain protein n=1 Tax=Streptomyces sp. TRM72054 TaxID=2870562 RepID=UPI0027DED81B|nr:ricin-type beta-trefoil lectin domain protein [Streptomyces sp. TRM72054]